MLDLAPVRVLAQQHPFRSETVWAEFDAGATVAQLVGDDAAYSLQVTIGGHDVPRALWPHVRPKPGVVVYIRAYPQGGSGGKILRTVAMVAVMAAAMWVIGPGAAAFDLTAGSFGATVLGVGVSMLGSLLVNALLPPPQHPMTGGQYNRLNSFTGTSNQAQPYAPIPLVLGQTRALPAIAPGSERYIRGVRFYVPPIVPGEVQRDVAIHESGHAIAAWWTGAGLLGVHAGEHDGNGHAAVAITDSHGKRHHDAAGITDYRPYIEGTDERSAARYVKHQTRAQRNELVLREIVHLIAGPMAEAFHKGYSFTPLALKMQSARSDMQATVIVSALLKPDDRQRVGSQAVALTSGMLAAHWSKVELLADALQARRTLTGAEAMEVIGSNPRSRLCPLSLGLAMEYAI